MSGAYTLTPGPLPLVNSMPAFSSALRMAARVLSGNGCGVRIVF